MPSKNFSKLRMYLKWIAWVLVVQLILVNVSAFIYAYKFTHFYDGPPPTKTERNVLQKTWKLFVGPDFYKNGDEPEPPFPYQQVTLQTSNNIAIDGWYSAADSSASCVIFLHGITVNKGYLVPEASMFRSWGYNILMIDFRGHGKSGGNNSTFGFHETDEVEKAVAYARSRGNQKIILYGVSLGAAISIKAVSENKVQPDAIIADMPFGSLHTHLKTRAHILGFPSQPFAALVTFWIGVRKNYNGFDHNVASYAEKVNCPVLLQWGEKDIYVKRNEIDGVYRSLSSKNKKLVIYPEADHESFLKIDPVTWQKEMAAFMNSLADQPVL